MFAINCIKDGINSILREVRGTAKEAKGVKLEGRERVAVEEGSNHEGEE